MKIRPLVWLAFLFFTWLAWLADSSAADGLKPSTSIEKDALQSVITSQLAAFRDGDFKAAYAFADEAIQAGVTVRDFEEMVKAGYPAIAKSVSAKFGLIFDNGEEAVVNVRVVGTDRAPVDYQYLLRRDGKSWRIHGVLLLQQTTTEV